MSGVNRAILVGNLGADPELKYTDGGQAVCNMRLATTESRAGKDGGERKEYTEWHRIQVWGATAEACAKYLKKGGQAYIEGRIQTREWIDKAGEKRYTTEIVASNVVFLGDKGGWHNETKDEERGMAPSRAPSGGGGAVLPNYGRSKNMPVAGASMGDLEFYANGARRSIADPAKAKYHRQERTLLAALEAEISRQQGGGGGGGYGAPNPEPGYQGAGADASDDIPFAYPPSRAVTEVGGHAYRRAVWRTF